MIGYEEALRIATDYLNDTSLRLTSPCHDAKSWFFSVGDDLVDCIPGGVLIEVDKESGSASFFSIPSIPYFVSGKEPTDNELRLESTEDYVIDQ